MKTILIYLLNISLLSIIIGLFITLTIIIARVNGWIGAAIFDFICITAVSGVIARDLGKEKNNTNTTKS